MAAENDNSYSGKAGEMIDGPSVIIPVFNAGAFIETNVRALHLFLSQRFASFEIVIVDDGSSDNTSAVLNGLSLPGLIVRRLTSNRGKFGAIREGMLAASGASRLFTDADLPFELEAIPYMHSLIVERKFHLVIGDRTLPESEYLALLSPLRRACSQAFSAFVRLMVAGGLFDTQCGLKGFRWDISDALFPLLKDEGFSGDVEVLYLALKYNLEIKRIPVRMKRSEDSSIRIVPHGVKMALQCLRLPARWRRGVYHSPVLSKLTSQSYWTPRAPEA